VPDFQLKKTTLQIAFETTGSKRPRAVPPQPVTFRPWSISFAESLQVRLFKKRAGKGKL